MAIQASPRGAPSSRAAWEFTPGHEIVPGRTVQGLLGGGGRHEAYVAWNHRLMTPTVIKILRPNMVDDARARRSLAKEGELLAGIQHPGVTRLFDMEATGERPFIEIEYADGPRLSTLIRRHGRLNPERTLALGRQLASTLHCLHAAGILHLDVKPSNIIMGPRPRLIDLSVARRIERAHRINGYVGTDAYMSPEQANPQLWAAIGPKADTWGLAATLYHAVARRLPHSRGRHEACGPERFPQLVESPAPLEPIPDSPGLAELIMEGLRRAPHERPSAAALSDRLHELAAQVSVGGIRFH